LDYGRLGAAALALACGATLAALPFVPDLRIREVIVAGAPDLDARVRGLAGLEGQNVFSASGNEAAARVRTVPRVRDARVRLQLPDRAVIEVEERAPLLVVAFSGGWLYADGTGALFEGTDPRREPTLEDETRTHVAGGRLEPGLVGATRWLRGQTAAIGGAVHRVRLTGAYGLVASLEVGTEVRLGSPDALEQKMNLARRIVQERGGRRLDYVDVRKPDIVVYFPRD
jgi:cell division septal protein FtsQ